MIRIFWVFASNRCPWLKLTMLTFLIRTYISRSMRFIGLPSFKVSPEGGCCVFQPASRCFSRHLLVDIELDRRTETSRPKLCIYHKVEILPQSRKPYGLNDHQTKKFIVITLLLKIIIWQNMTFMYQLYLSCFL